MGKAVGSVKSFPNWTLPYKAFIGVFILFNTVTDHEAQPGRITAILHARCKGKSGARRGEGPEWI